MGRILYGFLVVVLASCSTVNPAPNYRALAAKVVPSNVELLGDFYNPMTGEELKDKVFCSGFAISKTQIVTAGHCVNSEETAPMGKVRIRTYDGKVVWAEVVKVLMIESTNELSRDRALLRIQEPILHPVVIGDSDLLQVGDQVAIVGNSFGELTYSFTIGVVSYVNRKLDVGTFIQTDALSAGGNSGGPVFNMDGELIGMLTRGGGGISLVLPINQIFKEMHEKVAKY